MKDARLFALGVVTALVTSAAFVLMKPNWELISDVLFPSSVAPTALATAVATIFVFGLVTVFYRANPERTVLQPAAYFLAQSTLEEILFRFNIVMMLKSSGATALWIVVVVALLQAYFFAVLHNTKAFPKALVSSFVYFIACYYYGMIPAIIAHSAGNLLIRAKMLKDAGE